MSSTRELAEKALLACNESVAEVRNLLEQEQLALPPAIRRKALEAYLQKLEWMAAIAAPWTKLE